MLLNLVRYGSILIGCFDPESLREPNTPYQVTTKVNLLTSDVRGERSPIFAM